MQRLILASTSPYRRDLLARLGIEFTAIAPAVDERALQDDTLSSEQLAAKLALAKATSLRDTWPGATIIGSDQICTCEGNILHKPGDTATACRQLAMLAGRTHRLITAVAIVQADQVYEHLDITSLTMRPLTASEIGRYVAADQPLDCAGSYKLEQRGIALFARIDSADHTAITGLPLLSVVRLLRQCGYSIP